MMQYTFQIKQLKKGYMAFCPDMEPVSVFGKTEEQAVKKLDVAVGMYVRRHPEIIKTTRHSTLE